MKCHKSNKKIEVILEIAIVEFLTNGYSAASINRVAKVSQVSKATIYAHFKSKKELFAVLIEKLVQEKLKTVFKIINTQFFTEEPETALKIIATELLNSIGNDWKFQNLMRIVIGESGHFPELAKVYVNNFIKPASDILIYYFRSHPKLNIQDEEATARVFIGTIAYYIIMQEVLYGREIIPLEQNSLVNTLIKSIVRHSNIKEKFPQKKSISN